MLAPCPWRTWGPIGTSAGQGETPWPEACLPVWGAALGILAPSRSPCLLGTTCDCPGEPSGPSGVTGVNRT